MGSAALSIGSTTAMGVEDDANSFAMGTIQQVENDGNSYHTPTRRRKVSHSSRSLHKGIIHERHESRDAFVWQ